MLPDAIKQSSCLVHLQPPGRSQIAIHAITLEPASILLLIESGIPVELFRFRIQTAQIKSIRDKCGISPPTIAVSPAKFQCLIKLGSSHKSPAFLVIHQPED